MIHVNSGMRSCDPPKHAKPEGTISPCMLWSPLCRDTLIVSSPERLEHEQGEMHSRQANREGCLREMS